MSNIETRRIGFQTDALLAPQQALTAYFSCVELRGPRTENAALEDALFRVLAQDVRSNADYPVAARSAMDGFAVHSGETPGRFRLCGEIQMGQMWPDALTPGTAVRIPTGGVVPAGADAVVPVEDASVDGEALCVSDGVPSGYSITPPGADMREGEALLSPGRTLGGAELGVLATLGIATVAVYTRPRIAVLSSGDELVDVRTAPSPAQVRDSNRWAVAGTLQALGASVRHLPTAPDDPARLEALLREGVETCDAVVITGGSSVGERDFTPAIIARLGSPGVVVHGLRVKPGKPTVLAAVQGKPIIGLPGNPASALMILQAVAAPLIYALTGGRARPAIQHATLGAPLVKRPGWTWFYPMRLDEAAGDSVAYPLELRSSSASLLARASGFVALDETIESLAAGAPVALTRFLVGGN